MVNDSGVCHARTASSFFGWPLETGIGHGGGLSYKFNHTHCFWLTLAVKAYIHIYIYIYSTSTSPCRGGRASLNPMAIFTCSFRCAGY